MRPSDIEHLVVPARPTLRGDLLLTGLSRPDTDRNAYVRSLRRIPLDGGDLAWTYGERDSAPAISPDGRWVAFLRGDGKSGAQLHVMPSAGGEAKALTALPLGVDAPVWAPDSRRIAFTARVPEPGRYGVPDSEGRTLEADEEAPRRITRFDYRIDDIGFLADRRKRLFALDAVAALDEREPPELTPLTTEDADVSDPAWTPDSEAIVVVTPRDWGREETGHSDLCLIPAAGGEPELLVRCPGEAAGLTFDVEGTLYYLGNEFPGFSMEARNTGLWAVDLPANGGGPVAPRRLTETESVDCDVAAGRPVRFGDEVLVAVRNRGAVELRAVRADAENAPLAESRLITGDRAAVRGFTADGDRIAAIVATPESAGDVVLVEDGAERVLTDFSLSLRNKGIRPVEELTATSADGYPVHGWLALPEGDGPHPVLLAVHGGPFAAYDWGLFDEAQVYASAGYAVVLANPRGSAGYGQSHGRAIVHAFGTVDADDLLALLDAAVAREDLDSDRVGVMGGSYGGFMTSWLAAHHGERFRAAWSERAVNAWDSFAGSSDIGWSFVDAYISSDPVEQHRSSPLSYAEKIGIPFAVVHSEQDWRCPLEQAQRMFVALRRAGTEAELLVFPGEGHELTRSGKPRHRLQRFEAVLDWWSRHLPVS